MGWGKVIFLTANYPETWYLPDDGIQVDKVYVLPHRPPSFSSAAKIHDYLQLPVIGRTGKKPSTCRWATSQSIIKARLNKHHQVASSSARSRWRKMLDSWVIRTKRNKEKRGLHRAREAPLLDETKGVNIIILFNLVHKGINFALWYAWGTVQNSALYAIFHILILSQYLLFRYDRRRIYETPRSGHVTCNMWR